MNRVGDRVQRDKLFLAAKANLTDPVLVEHRGGRKRAVASRIRCGLDVRESQIIWHRKTRTIGQTKRLKNLVCPNECRSNDGIDQEAWSRCHYQSTATSGEFLDPVNGAVVEAYVPVRHQYVHLRQVVGLIRHPEANRN